MNRLDRYLTVDPDNLILYFYNDPNHQKCKINDIYDKKSYKIGSPGNIYFERESPYTPPPTQSPTPIPTINTSLVTKIQGDWDNFYRNGIPIGPVTFYYIGNNTFYIDGLRNGRGLYENKRYLKVDPITLVATYPFFNNQQIGKLFFNRNMSKAVYFGSNPSIYSPNPPYDGFIRLSSPNDMSSITPIPTYEYSTTPMPIPTIPVPTIPYTPFPLVIPKISNPTSNLIGYWYLNSSVIVNYNSIINVVEENLKTGAWWSKQWIGKSLNNTNIIRFYNLYNNLMFTSSSSNIPGQNMTWKINYTYMNGEPYVGDLFYIKRVYLNNDKWCTYDDKPVDFN